MRDSIPAIFYGDVEDATTWTSISGGSVVAGATDPLGSLEAFAIVDDNAGSLERVASPTISFARNGSHYGAIILRIETPGASGTSRVQITDFDDSFAHRWRTVITWGSPPIVNDASGATLGIISLGGGWYAFLFRADNVIASNDNRVDMFPGNTSSDEAVLHVYPRRVVFLGTPLDDAATIAVKGLDHERIQAVSGTRDAWVGPDWQRLSGAARWIPPTHEGSPHVISGWDGAGESIIVGTGWDDFLRRAWNEEAVVFCPDRSDCTEFVGVALVSPSPGESPGLEEDGTKHLDLVLEALNKDQFRGY